MTRAVHVLQFVNCFLSALGAALLYRVLRQVTRSTYLSVCLALLFAFSATWWKFSTDADSYIATTLLLVAAFDLLLPGKRPRPLAVALLHAAAMTFHQLAVFFFPVALLGIYFQTGGLPRRRRLSPSFFTHPRPSCSQSSSITSASTGGRASRRRSRCSRG